MVIESQIFDWIIKNWMLSTILELSKCRNRQRLRNDFVIPLLELKNMKINIKKKHQNLPELSKLKVWNFAHGLNTIGRGPLMEDNF